MAISVLLKELISAVLILMVQVTDWIAKNNGEPVINDKLNNMDARYIPTVLNFNEHRSTDAQGLQQVQDIIFNDGNPAKTPAQPSATILSFSWMLMAIVLLEQVRRQPRKAKKWGHLS